MYSNMKLEDFPPFQKAQLFIGYFGPAPRCPASCVCGRFIVDNFCACASSCMDMPKYKWMKENPDLYAAEQAEERRWRRLCDFWNNISGDWAAKNWLAVKPAVLQFNRLRDAETEMGCYECTQQHRTYCRCACDSCGNKYCDGMCHDEYDY
jgi:hypothetical protein